MKKCLFSIILSILSLSVWAQAPGLRVLVNNGKHYTNEETVKLNIVAPHANQMMISNSEAFSGAKWETFVPAKNWQLDASSDGMKHIYLKFKDKAGNQSPVISGKIVLDKTPPQGGSIVIEKGKPITNNSTVHLEIKAKEAHEMMVSNRNNFAGARWSPYAELISSWHLEGADGEKTVYVKFRDKVGNVSGVSSASIKLDKTPPKGSIKINEGEQWTNTPNVKLHIKADDASEMMVSTMGKEWIPYKEVVDIKLPEPDGHKAVHAKLRDKAHNLSATLHTEINLKTNPPVNAKIRIDHGHKYFTKPDKRVDLELHAEGANFMMICQNPNFEGGSWEPYSAYKKGVMLEGEDGEKKIYAKYKDQAGNETEPVEAHIILDREAPAGGSVTINDGAEGTNDVHVKLKIEVPSDAVGMQVSPYSSFGGAHWEKATAEKEFELLGADGVKPVYVRFRDEAGNFSKGVSSSIKLDRRPPTANMIKIENGAEWANKPTVNLSLSSSGAVEMMISDDPHFEGAKWEKFASSKDFTLSGEDGMKVVGVKFRDDAGNVAPPVVGKIKLSTKPPSECKIVIDEDKEFTTRRDRRVALRFHAKNAVKMKISNTPDFNGARWAVYSENRPVWVLSGGEGEKTVYAKFISGSGIESEVVSDKIILDYTPPKKGKMVINDGAKGTNAKDGKINIKFSAEDAVEMMFTDNRSFAGKTWEPFKKEMEWTLQGSDGLKILLVKFKDKAGNISPQIAEQIKLDRNPPRGSIVINDGQKATTSNVVKLKIVAEEAYQMQVSNTSSFGDMPWQDIQTMMTWNVTGEDGIKTVYARFRDHANNISEVVSDNIEMDTKPPGEGSIVINDGAEYTTDKLGKVKIKLKSEGAKFMKISNRTDFKGSSWIQYVEERDWRLLPGENERKVNVKFKDDAGNETSPVFDIITVDYTPPASGKVIIDKGAQFSKDPDHNVQLEIASNGADEMMIANDANFTNGQWEPYATSKSWVLDPPGDGKREVYVKFRDKAGNTSTPVMDDITIDTKF